MTKAGERLIAAAKEAAAKAKPLSPRERRLAAVIRELHWMARRYAEGRQTYAASSCNDATREALALGVDLAMPDGTLWAADGTGEAGYSGLSEEEMASALKSKTLRLRLVPEIAERADR